MLASSTGIAAAGQRPALDAHRPPSLAQSIARCPIVGSSPGSCRTRTGPMVKCAGTEVDDDRRPLTSEAATNLFPGISKRERKEHEIEFAARQSATSQRSHSLVACSHSAERATPRVCLLGADGHRRCRCSPTGMARAGRGLEQVTLGSVRPAGMRSRGVLGWCGEQRAGGRRRRAKRVTSTNAGHA